MAPRRMVPSDRAMTALRPPIRPTSDVMAPTIPLPTAGASSNWVTRTECRPAGEPDLEVVRLRPAPGTGAAPGLLPQREVLDGHGPVRRLAHVVDRERGDGAGRHRLHFDPGAVHGLDLGLDLDVVVTDGEVHADGSDQDGVAQGDQLRRAPRGLDPGDPGRRQHIPLGDGV